MSDPGSDIRRILVALDASPDSEAALEAAARLCEVFHASLAGVYVEDEDLLRAAELPFTREIRRHSAGEARLSRAELSRQLRLQQFKAGRALERAAAAHGVSYAFRVAKGRVPHALLEEARSADLITIGQAGTSYASPSKLGSTARTLVAHAPGSVLIARRGVRLDLPVVVLFDTQAPDREYALTMASQLAASDLDSPLSVLVAGPESLMTDIAGDIQRFVPPRLQVRVHAVNCEIPEHFVQQVSLQKAGLLILPHDSRLAHLDRLGRVASRIALPILVARPSPAAG